MRVQLCMNNLDLFMAPDVLDLKAYLIFHGLQNSGTWCIEEEKCLGYCFACQCGPFALIDEKFAPLTTSRSSSPSEGNLVRVE